MLSRGQNRPESEQAHINSVITINQVRPQPRKQNEYVDTPHALPRVHSAKSPTTAKPAVVKNIETREHVPLPSRSQGLLSNAIVRHQPVSTSPSLKKDLPIEISTDNSNSIICSKCSKCKCGACTNPRELPSRWLCGGSCNVSPESVVEYVTCLKCVKGVFYHCSKDDQDAEFECDSDPCACGRPRCWQRWTCIFAMSLCLPCLCLYPPAKLGLNCCTGIYNKCGRKGCKCKNTSSNQSGKTSRSRTRIEKDSSSQCRGLLIESDRESSSVSNS